MPISSKQQAMIDRIMQDGSGRQQVALLKMLKSKGVPDDEIAASMGTAGAFDVMVEFAKSPFLGSKTVETTMGSLARGAAEGAVGADIAGGTACQQAIREMRFGKAPTMDLPFLGEMDVARAAGNVAGAVASPVFRGLGLASSLLKRAGFTAAASAATKFLGGGDATPAEIAELVAVEVGAGLLEKTGIPKKAIDGFVKRLRRIGGDVAFRMDVLRQSIDPKKQAELVRLMKKAPELPKKPAGLLARGSRVPEEPFAMHSESGYGPGSLSGTPVKPELVRPLPASRQLPARGQGIRKTPGGGPSMTPAEIKKAQARLKKPEAV